MDHKLLASLFATIFFEKSTSKKDNRFNRSGNTSANALDIMQQKEILEIQIE
jgi:hypothetical protein